MSTGSRESIRCGQEPRLLRPAAGDDTSFTTSVMQFETFTMQPATGIDGQVITILNEEQLQILTRAARVLGQGVEEIVEDVTRCYTWRLLGLAPAAWAEASEIAVREWATMARKRQMPRGRPQPARGGTLLDFTFEALHKRQEALAYDLRVGRYARNQRAVPLLAAAVDEAVAAARQLSVDEGWTEARLAARLDEIRGPADGLMREMRGALLDAAVAKWMTKVTNLCEGGYGACC